MSSLSLNFIKYYTTKLKFEVFMEFNYLYQVSWNFDVLFSNSVCPSASAALVDYQYPHSEDAHKALILIPIPVQLFMSGWQKTNEICPVKFLFRYMLLFILCASIYSNTMGCLSLE